VIILATGIAAFLAITIRFLGHAARIPEKAENRQDGPPLIPNDPYETTAHKGRGFCIAR